MHFAGRPRPIGATLSENQTPYVARSEDLSALHAHWNQAAEGAPKALRLQAPFGGGRRALVGQFMREAAAQRDEAVFWRVNCLDQENGVQWLVRMYGSLVATLGDLERAEGLFGEALARARELGDRRREGSILGSMGLNLLRSGELRAGRELLVEALEVHRSVGNQRSEGIVQGYLGIAAYVAGPEDE